MILYLWKKVRVLFLSWHLAVGVERQSCSPCLLAWHLHFCRSPPPFSLCLWLTDNWPNFCLRYWHFLWLRLRRRSWGQESWPPAWQTSTTTNITKFSFCEVKDDRLLSISNNWHISLALKQLARCIFQESELETGNWRPRIQLPKSHCMSSDENIGRVRTHPCLCVSYPIKCFLDVELSARWPGEWW